MTYTERNSEDRRRKSPRKAYDQSREMPEYVLDKLRRTRRLLKQIDRELGEAEKAAVEMAGKKVA